MTSKVECPATTTDLGNSTKCHLQAGHDGDHDDGAITFKDPMKSTRPSRELVDEFSDDFLEHAVKNAAQYDSTCRTMAKNILRLRWREAELIQQRDEARAMAEGMIPWAVATNADRTEKALRAAVERWKKET